MEAKIGNENCILVPTDFSPVCLNALLHAVELSKVSNCDIFLLHVLTDDQDSEITHELMLDESNYLKPTNPLKPIAEMLQEFIDCCDYDAIYPIIRKGDFFVTLNDVIEEINADMIVLGTHGKVGIQKIIGSYAVKVIDTSGIPVVIVQENAKPKKYQTIVFPIKHKEGDRQKTQLAVYIAKANNAKVHIFPFYGQNGVDYSRLKNEIIQICNYFNKYGIAYEVIDNFNDTIEFDQQILNYSIKTRADLIIIMSNAVHHHIISGAKEESLLFNKQLIPVLCLNRKKVKHNASAGFVSGN